jgi:hypothetical protein
VNEKKQEVKRDIIKPKVNKGIMITLMFQWDSG